MLNRHVRLGDEIKLDTEDYRHIKKAKRCGYRKGTCGEDGGNGRGEQEMRKGRR